MKKTRLIKSFFLISGRDIVKKFMAFFRFTEADACTLLSVYGVHALEVDRLQNNRLNEPDQSPKGSSSPADLDTALVEIAHALLAKSSRENPHRRPQRSQSIDDESRINRTFHPETTLRDL